MREAFATLVTLVGFLSGVQPAVLNQMVLMLKGLVADLALVGALACIEYTEIISNPIIKKRTNQTEIPDIQ